VPWVTSNPTSLNPEYPNYREVITMQVKTIICLANSRKNGESCIAGKEIKNNQIGQWVRPVSGRLKGGITLEEQAYGIESYPKLLDVIRVPIIRVCPSVYQNENWLIEPKIRWEKTGSCNVSCLEKLATKTGPLWINGYSSKNGENNYVPIDETKSFISSLILIDVDDLVLSISEFEGARKLRGTFSLGKTVYDLPITDRSVESSYDHRRPGKYSLGRSYLTISLAQEFQGNAYKLIAAIIPQNSDTP